MTKLKTSIISTCNSEDNIKYKIEKATETLDRNIGFIKSCDSKTSIVLTAIGVLLTIILTNDGLNAIYNIIQKCINDRTFSSILYLILFATILVVLFLGLYNLLSVLIGRVNINEEPLDSSNSNIFFSGIIKKGNLEAYRKEFYRMDHKQLLDELIGEIYINANIANKKYNSYNTGIKLSILGLLLFVTILLIGIYIYWGDLIWQVMIINKGKRELQIF